MNQEQWNRKITISIIDYFKLLVSNIGLVLHLIDISIVNNVSLIINQLD